MFGLIGGTGKNNGGVDPTAIDTTAFTALLMHVLNWALALIGLVTLVYLIVAGIQYIIAAGNEGNQAAAKKAIQSAIIGLILVVLAATLVNTLLKYLCYNGSMIGRSGQTPSQCPPKIP